MSRRSLAIVIAVPLMVALWIAAALLPVPYVTYHPGVTVDVLSEAQGAERIQIDGHKAYYGDGELRMTTVSVTRAEDHVSLFEVLGSWLSDEEAVQPYSAVYEENETDAENQQESAVEMVSSQDAAIAVALRALDIKVTPVVEIFSVTPGTPSEGKLQVRDRLLSIDGTKIDTPQQVVDAVDGAKVGQPLEFVVRRAGKQKTVEVAPARIDGRKMIGIWPGPGFAFPFRVDINIDPRIGGPSAGLMFSLAIYDTLTPGSLTGGKRIAGTGTINSDGQVGPIGGIQQKIVGARNAGAELFLVPGPADGGNCEEAAGAPNEDTRLVPVSTFDEALQAIETWVDDPDADLPTCQD